MDTIKLVYEGPSRTRQFLGVGIVERGVPFEGPASLADAPNVRVVRGVGEAPMAGAGSSTSTPAEGEES